jgi:uncharacterized membrane protein YoaK (UPF0700 family)
MRVPTPRDPRQGSSRCTTVRYALGSNARTARFCVIWLVMTGGPIAGAVLAVVLHHIRLCLADLVPMAAHGAITH